MKSLLIEMLTSAAIAVLIYYGLVFAGMTDPRWTAAIAAGIAIALVAIGRRISQHQKRT